MHQQITVRGIPLLEKGRGFWHAGKFWPVEGLTVELVDSDEDPPGESGKIGRRTLARLRACKQVSVDTGDAAAIAAAQAAEVEALKKKAADAEAAQAKLAKQEAELAALREQLAKAKERQSGQGNR